MAVDRLVAGLDGWHAHVVLAHTLEGNMRRIAVVMLTAGIFAGGLGVVGASSASADETGSVRITNRDM